MIITRKHPGFDLSVCANGLVRFAFVFSPTFRRCVAISKQEMQINEEIRDPQVRVVDGDGGQLGIMSSKDALRLATERNLDLVKIAPGATPPVCRIMDYGKYRFEQAKREKEARKNQKIVELKEIWLSMNIEQHDFETKAGHAIRFLKDGDKVKVSIRFRGREMAHMNLGAETMKRFAAFCAEYGVVEKAPLVDGRKMLMILAPKPAAKASSKPQKQKPQPAAEAEAAAE